MVVNKLAENSFALNVFATLIGALLAVVLGIPASLWVERLLEKRRTAKDAVQLRGAIREVLEKNLKLLKQMKCQFTKDPPEFPTYALDATLLQSVSSRKYDVLKNIRICKAVDSATYEICHFNRKLDATMRVMPLSEGSGSAKAFLVSLRKSLSDHMPIVWNHAEKALSELGFPVSLRFDEDDAQDQQRSDGD